VTLRVRERRSVGNIREHQLRRHTGLVERKKADWIAGGVFLIAFIFLFVLLSNTALQSFPTTTTTTTSTLQTVRSASGITQQTKTVEITKSDVVPSFWQGVIGHRTPTILLIAITLLLAFLVAGAVQRVLLGNYGFSIGPLTIPEITAEQVREAADSTLASVPTESQAATGEDTPDAWETVSDPNLALAGWRIEVERELRRIGEEYHIPPSQTRSAGRLLASLSGTGAIEPEAVRGLRELISLANEGVHGASVDQSVVHVLHDEGRNVLRYLRSVHG
jgi:cytoskeletal protein RodZ